MHAAVRARLGYDPFFAWARDTLFVEIRICIYCMEEKGKALFNRDHVIPEAFGTFDDYLVLTSVCQACNQFMYGTTWTLS